MKRFAFLDWMRGLACLLMFQTHCYDAWLSPEARKTTFFMYSQLAGTLPAPLFLFLAGISFALFFVCIASNADHTPSLPCHCSRVAATASAAD